MARKLIEDGEIALVELFDEVSQEAKKEKLSFSIPPINKMLYWWTRKPLVVSRAVALTSIINDSNIDEKLSIGRRLLNINNKDRAYKYDPKVDGYKSELELDVKVLDPFGGAGNIIFEAKRLGLDCTALDYNPVAYLLMKGVLEYPVKYGYKLVEDVKKYGKEVINRSKKELERFYHREGRVALAYLWCWCIRCPYCKQRVPLMNHMWFVRTNKKKIGVRIKPTDDYNFSVEIVNNISNEEGNKFTQKKR